MRPLTAFINTRYLRHNYRWLKAQHKGPLLAVIKSNAYGHGMIPCARALADIADGFAVMHLEEARLLRAEGIHLPILLLEGVLSKTELLLVAKQNLWLSVQSSEQINTLLSAHLPTALQIWLKMDTGLCRGGILPAHYAQAYKQLAHHQNVQQIVYMTHFACADDLHHPMTNLQIAQFDQACSSLPKNPVSSAASSAILGHPNTHRGWGRAGLALYGISPLIQDVPHALKPVMTFSTHLFDIHDVPAGQYIGYGATYQTIRPSKIGLITCGYGDGYPRLVSSGIPVRLHHTNCPIVGRPSMNLITIDLTNVLSPKIGTSVELWGNHISVNTIAQAAGTSAYEVFCHVKPNRLVYPTLGKDTASNSIS
ncbi:MAG: alanine racemase [Neisseriales bacterium]|nr:MAG: alanine racemase [Neisseriales bacterium]